MKLSANSILGRNLRITWDTVSMCAKFRCSNSWFVEIDSWKWRLSKISRFRPRSAWLLRDSQWLQWLDMMSRDEHDVTWCMRRSLWLRGTVRQRAGRRRGLGWEYELRHEVRTTEGAGKDSDEGHMFVCYELFCYFINWLLDHLAFSTVISEKHGYF